MVIPDKFFEDVRLEEESTLRGAQMVMLRILKVVDYICEKHHLKYWLSSGTLLGAVRHKGFIPWDDDLDIAMEREDYEIFLKVAANELQNYDLFLQTRDTDPFYTYLPISCKIRDNKSLILSELDLNKRHHRGIFIDVFAVDKFHEKGLMFCFERITKKYFYFLMSCSDAPGYKNKSLFKHIISYFNPVFNSLLEYYIDWIPKKINENRLLTGNYKLGFGFDVPWGRFWSQSTIYPLKKIPFEDGEFWAPNDTDAFLKESYGDTYMQLPPENKRETHANLNIELIVKNNTIINK